METDELVEIIDGSIGELRDEVRVLRMAVDELRELLDWITRNPEMLAGHCKCAGSDVDLQPSSDDSESPTPGGDIGASEQPGPIETRPENDPRSSKSQVQLF